MKFNPIIIACILLHSSLLINAVYCKPYTHRHKTLRQPTQQVTPATKDTTQAKILLEEAKGIEKVKAPESLIPQPEEKSYWQRYMPQSVQNALTLTKNYGSSWAQSFKNFIKKYPKEIATVLLMLTFQVGIPYMLGPEKPSKRTPTGMPMTLEEFRKETQGSQKQEPKKK